MRRTGGSLWTMPLSAVRLGVEVFARTAEAMGAAAGQGIDEMVGRGVRGLAASGMPAPSGPVERAAAPQAPAGGRKAPCQGCGGGSFGDAAEALGPLGPLLLLAPLAPLAPMVPVAAPMLLVLAPLAVLAAAGADAAWRAVAAAFEWAAGGDRHAGEPGESGDAELQASPRGGAGEAGADTGEGGGDRPGEGADLRDDRVKLVRYTLLSLRPEEERILRRGETLVTEPLPGSAFAAWVIGQYLDAHQLPADDRRYLRVHREVAARFDRQPFNFPQRQVEALEEIRDALLAQGRTGGTAECPPWTFGLAGPRTGAGSLQAAAVPAPPANPVATEEEDHG
jgi:hypothetical protein